MNIRLRYDERRFGEHIRARTRRIGKGKRVARHHAPSNRVPQIVVEIGPAIRFLQNGDEVGAVEVEKVRECGAGEMHVTAIDVHVAGNEKAIEP